MRPLAVLLLFAAGAGGCVLPAIDPVGRRCPCGPGWVCDRGVCVPEGDVLDAGPLDAGAPPDAGSREDAGPPLDAGAPPDGGGEPDAALDAGPPADRCESLFPSALFCDGFEFDYPGARGRWGWDLVTGGGTLETVTVPPARFGDRALAAEIPASGARAAIGVHLETPVVDGELWLRGFYYLPSKLTVDSVSLLYVGTIDGSAGIAFQMYDGGLASAWIGTAGEWRGTGVPIPRDRWACLQLHIVIAEPPASGTVEVLLDDVLLRSFTGLDTAPVSAGGFGAVEAGIEYSSSMQPAGSLFVDEVVLSRTRVPCE